MSLQNFAAIFFAASLSLSACSGNSPADPKRRSEPSRGFFERLADNLTDRECNVVRFACPYGFGPAEPCECTDPRGTVLPGRTVK